MVLHGVFSKIHSFMKKTKNGPFKRYKPPCAPILVVLTAALSHSTFAHNESFPCSKSSFLRLLSAPASSLSRSDSTMPMLMFVVPRHLLELVWILVNAIFTLAHYGHNMNHLDDVCCCYWGMYTAGTANIYFWFLAKDNNDKVCAWNCLHVEVNDSDPANNALWCCSKAQRQLFKAQAIVDTPLLTMMEWWCRLDAQPVSF